MENSLLVIRPIETERLRLRPLVGGDAEAFRAITDDPKVVESVAFLSGTFTLQDSMSLIEKNAAGQDCFIGVWSKNAQTLIGQVGAHLVGKDEIEVGYWLGSAYHGQGYASEALQAVIGCLRGFFPERQIIAECLSANKASWNVLHKAGFVPSGEAGHREGRRRLLLSSSVV